MSSSYELNTRVPILRMEPPSSQQVSLIEQELIDCIRRKKEMDRLLIDLEVQLYNYETSFLEKYSASGSIVKGFDPSTFLSLLTGGSSTGTISESDRIFSSSSLTTQKALQLKQKSSGISPHFRPKKNSFPKHSNSSFFASGDEQINEYEHDEDELDDEDEPYNEGKKSKSSISRKRLRSRKHRTK